MENRELDYRGKTTALKDYQLWDEIFLMPLLLQISLVNREKKEGKWSSVLIKTLGTGT